MACGVYKILAGVDEKPPAQRRVTGDEAQGAKEGCCSIKRGCRFILPAFVCAQFSSRETSGYETDVRRSRKLTFVEMMSARLGSFQVYHRKRLSLKRK